MPRTTTTSLAALVAILAACSPTAAPPAPAGPPPKPDEAASPAVPKAAAAAAPAPAATAAGPQLYSGPQAERGRTVFVETCSDCHDTSDFTDAEFQFKWGRRTVWALLRDIRSNMPDDDPGGLPSQQYIDVVAYILQLNGFPQGEAEMTADQDALAAHVLKAPNGTR